jgi:hypothetical protein
MLERACSTKKDELKEIEAQYGDQVEIVYHTGPGNPEWET